MQLITRKEEVMKKHTKTLLILCSLMYLFFIFYKYNTRQVPIQQDDKTTPLMVVTTFYPLYLHTERLTRGTPTQVINMTDEVVGCLHDYQLTTKDMKTLYKADMLVTSGLDEQSLIEKVYIQHPELQVVKVDEGWLDFKEVHDHHEAHDHHDDDHHDDDHHDDEHHHAVNTHTWMSLDAAKLQIEKLADALIARDPAHKNQYESNKKAYLEGLETLKARQQQSLGKGIQPVVTVHDTFDYLLEDLDIEVVATIPEGTYESPSPQVLEALIKTMKEQGVTTIITEERYKDLTLIKLIQEETQGKVLVLDSLLASDEAHDYISRMAANYEKIEEFLP